MAFFKFVNLQGALGSVSVPVWGFDVVLRPSKLFLLSKSSFSTILNFLTKSVTLLNSGFFLELLLVGLGFRIIRLGQILLLKVGYAHYIKITIPGDIHVLGYKKRLFVFGISFYAVNQFSQRLVSFRPPDVYKNKGIQLVGNSFRIKLGKQK